MLSLNFNLLDISNLEPKYELNEKICDGQNWSLKFKSIGKPLIEVKGHMAYPDNWNEFLFIVSKYSTIHRPTSLMEFNLDGKIALINKVDITTAFAILTLLQREDHFSCPGSIQLRIEDGSLNKVIDRIKFLLSQYLY